MDIQVVESTVSIEDDSGPRSVEKKAVEALVVTDGAVVAVDQGDIAAISVQQPAVVAVEQPVTEAYAIAAGPQGPRGVPGDLTLLGGSTTGDFLRYNTVTQEWEVAAEPIAVKGLVLTPAAASEVTAEGAIFYKSTTKTIEVCTDAV